MDKEKAIEWVVSTKAISALTRNFVEWLYREGYVILAPEERVTPEKEFRLGGCDEM